MDTQEVIQLAIQNAVTELIKNSATAIFVSNRDALDSCGILDVEVALKFVEKPDHKHKWNKSLNNKACQT